MKVDLWIAFSFLLSFFKELVFILKSSQLSFTNHKWMTLTRKDNFWLIILKKYHANYMIYWTDSN